MIYGEELVHILCISWTWLSEFRWCIGFFRKGCLRNESASHNFGEQNHLPPKKLATKKKDGALQKRNDAVLFCCPRGRGVSSRFVIFGCCSCFKKGFHFKCVGSTSSWSVLHISANVWDSLLREKKAMRLFYYQGIWDSRVKNRFSHFSWLSRVITLYFFRRHIGDIPVSTQAWS